MWLWGMMSPTPSLPGRGSFGTCMLYESLQDVMFLCFLSRMPSSLLHVCVFQWVRNVVWPTTENRALMACRSDPTSVIVVPNNFKAVEGTQLTKGMFVGKHLSHGLQVTSPYCLYGCWVLKSRPAPPNHYQLTPLQHHSHFPEPMKVVRECFAVVRTMQHIPFCTH
jgi:hypothetical protein